MAQKVTGYIKLQIPAAKATASPPVGPALGQHGVNIAQFIKEFNERTKDQAGFKIPEIGWNQVREVDAKGEVGQRKEFYFVHSYYAEIGPETVGVSEYAGVEFTAMVKRGRLWACQFHPEKSGRVGLSLLKEWLAC